MKIFLVNLVRRPDRLNAMSSQFRQLGLTFCRIPAIDAKIVSDEWLAGHFSRGGPLGTISKGDKCCLLSHQRAWAAFLSTGDPYGVVVEDDIALAPSAGELLRDNAWIPPSVDLLKLEHFGPDSQRVLLGRPVGVGGGRTVSEIHSRHTGAAAYVISRAAARLLLSPSSKWVISVDHVLFNPNVSSLARKLRPHQLLPVLARQTSFFGGATDIDGWRALQRHLSWSYVKRELRRAYYDVRLLPQQIARVVSGRGTLVRVRNDELVRVMARTRRPRPPEPVEVGHGAA